MELKPITLTLAPPTSAFAPQRCCATTVRPPHRPCRNVTDRASGLCVWHEECGQRQHHGRVKEEAVVTKESECDLWNTSGDDGSAKAETKAEGHEQTGRGLGYEDFMLFSADADGSGGWDDFCLPTTGSGDGLLDIARVDGYDRNYASTQPLFSSTGDYLAGFRERAHGHNCANLSAYTGNDNSQTDSTVVSVPTAARPVPATLPRLLTQEAACLSFVDDRDWHGHAHAHARRGESGGSRGVEPEGHWLGGLPWPSQTYSGGEGGLEGMEGRGYSNDKNTGINGIYVGADADIPIHVDPALDMNTPKVMEHQERHGDFLVGEAGAGEFEDFPALGQGFDFPFGDPTSALFPQAHNQDNGSGYATIPYAGIPAPRRDSSISPFDLSPRLDMHAPSTTETHDSRAYNDNAYNGAALTNSLPPVATESPRGATSTPTVGRTLKDRQARLMAYSGEEDKAE